MNNLFDIKIYNKENKLIHMEYLKYSNTYIRALEYCKQWLIHNNNNNNNNNNIYFIRLINSETGYKYKLRKIEL